MTLSSGKIKKAHISEIDDILQKDGTSGVAYYKVMIQFDSPFDFSEGFNHEVLGKILVSDKPMLRLLFK